MDGVKKIVYKGREILYIDYRGMNEAQMIQTLKHVGSIVLAENKLHLQLTNITNAYATPAFMNVANEIGKQTKELTLKGAIVGITGAKKILLMGYNMLIGGKIKPFDTEEEAKEFLIMP